MQHAITTAVPFGAVDLESTGKPRGRSVHKMPVAFSAAYFSAALATDLVYWQIPNVMWERFMMMLIVAGLVVSGIAGIACLSKLAGRRKIERPAWTGVFGYAVAV